VKKLIFLLVAITLSFAVKSQKSKANSEVADGTVISTYSCSMHPDVKSDKPGKCSKCGNALALTPKEKMKMDVVAMYACPMHPDVTSDMAGKCVKCSMDLTEMAYSCPTHPNVVMDKPGKCPKCRTTLNLTPKEKMKIEAMKLVTCPMHADVTSSKPGKCSKCGMDLTKKKQ
jgi:hypothetical protein